MNSLGLHDLAVDFLDRFQHSEYRSPDRFLEIYDEYSQVGKYAIASVLSRLEMDRNFFSLTGRVAPWYEVLIDHLEFDNRQYSKNLLSILTFNYDRSLEYFLWRVIDPRYRHDKRKVRRLWKDKPKITHLHGLLGEFDPIDGSGRPFAPPDDTEEFSPELRIAAEGIKIIHEIEPETSEFDEAERVLSKAKRVFFLGFGFDRRNVQRLRYFERIPEDVAICGTGRGLTAEERTLICQEVFQDQVRPNAFAYGSIRELLGGAHLSFAPSRIRVGVES